MGGEPLFKKKEWAKPSFKQFDMGLVVVQSIVSTMF